MTPTEIDALITQLQGWIKDEYAVDRPRTKNLLMNAAAAIIQIRSEGDKDYAGMKWSARVPAPGYYWVKIESADGTVGPEPMQVLDNPNFPDTVLMINAAHSYTAAERNKGDVWLFWTTPITPPVG